MQKTILLLSLVEKENKKWQHQQQQIIILNCVQSIPESSKKDCVNSPVYKDQEELLDRFFHEIHRQRKNYFRFC